MDLANPVIRGLLFRLGEEIRNPGFGSETLAELMAGQLAIELGRHFRAIRESHSTGGLAAVEAAPDRRAARRAL